MSKDQSLALKGVAIIMMVLYHLFYVPTGGTYFSAFGESGLFLIKRFSEICYPVSLYIMISGYGLYSSKVSGHSSKSNWRRIKYIYEHVWIILLIFVPFASWLHSNQYPDSFLTLLGNALCFSSSYNAEYWFVFPYIIILLLSGHICNLISRNATYISLTIAIAIYLIYLILYKTIGLETIRDKIGVAFELYIVMPFLFPFTLGAIAKKENLTEKIGNVLNKVINKDGRQDIVSLVIILSIVAFRMFLPNQSFQVICVFVLFLLFPYFKFGNALNSALLFLGKHSMNIWLIHTWFCYYLLKDFIYGLKYPILIFIVTMGMSILVSIGVEWLYSSISKFVKLCKIT